MRLTQFRSRSHAAARVFTSPKCASAIPVRDVLVRDAIVQATLDPAVQKIEFGPLEVPDPVLAVGAVVIERDGQRYLLDHRSSETARPSTLDDEGALLVAVENLGLKLWPMDARAIRREPRFSNSREVWRYRNHDVPLSDRLQIMHALAEEGPQSIMELATRIYARTAHENMAEIDRQVEACSLRAAALGAEVRFLFIDNGVSGMVIGEGLQHLLETARLGGFDYVVVADHDRLARSFSVKSFVLAELSTAGVEVERACEPFRPRGLDAINPGFQ